MIPFGGEAHVDHGPRLDGHWRGSGNNGAIGRCERFGGVVMTLRIRGVRLVLLSIGFRRITVVMVMTLKARREADRDRPRHHSVGTQQHKSSSEARDLLCPVVTKQGPACAHDYVALQ